MQNIRPGRLVAAAAFVLPCIAFGLSAPLVFDFDFDANEFKLSNVAVHAAARGGHEISAPVDLVPALRIRLERGTIAVDHASGKRVADDSDTLPRDGSAKLVIDDGVFQVAGSEPVEGEAQVGPAAPLLEAVKALNFEALAIRRSTVRLALPDGRLETLTGVTGEIMTNRRTGIIVRGSGTFRGQTVAFDLATPAAFDLQSGSRVPMKLRLKSPLLDIAFDGRVGASEALHLQGRMDLAMANVRQTARWLGASWPLGAGLRDASIKGEFEWQGQVISFDRAAFKMDGNAATGTLALSFAGPRPALTGTLALKSLDLSPYVHSKPDGHVAAFLAWALSEDGSLAAPIGRLLDADIRLSAGDLRAGSMEFGRFAASLSLKKGRLLADVVEISVDGGRASGQVTADFGTDQPQLAIRGRLEDIDASRATTALLGHSALQGLSTITVDITSAGDSIPELMNALKGKVAFSLQEGGKIGIDVKSLLDAAQKGKLEGWEAVTRGQTLVDGLEAKLRVDKGIVASELVEATAGSSLLRAIGTVSLPSRQLDMRLLLDAVPEATKANIPNDVLVFRGPLSAPSITVER